MAEDSPSLADRMAAARAAWQHDTRMQRGPAPAEAPAHVPQFISPFRAFEVMHGIEMREVGRRNTVSDIRDFEDMVDGIWQSRQMPIEKIRQLPDFVSEQWILWGRKEDGSQHQVGQFSTEKQARDVLGGITGDRQFDQHPAQDWTLATAWAGFAHNPDDEKQSLSDRMREDWTDSQASNHLSAKYDALTRARAEAENQLWKDHPIKTFLLGPEAREMTVNGNSQGVGDDRPNERLLGDPEQDNRQRGQRW